MMGGNAGVHHFEHDYDTDYDVCEECGYEIECECGEAECDHYDTYIEWMTATGTNTAMIAANFSTKARNTAIMNTTIGSITTQAVTEDITTAKSAAVMMDMKPSIIIRKLSITNMIQPDMK